MTVISNGKLSRIKPIMKIEQALLVNIFYQNKSGHGNCVRFKDLQKGTMSKNMLYNKI